MSIKIYNFDNVIEDEERDYAGMSGSKLAIIFENENWFLKYPRYHKIYE